MFPSHWILFHLNILSKSNLKKIIVVQLHKYLVPAGIIFWRLPASVPLRIILMLSLLPFDLFSLIFLFALNICSHTLNCVSLDLFLSRNIINIMHCASHRVRFCWSFSDYWSQSSWSMDKGLDHISLGRGFASSFLFRSEFHPIKPK